MNARIIGAAILASIGWPTIAAGEALEGEPSPAEILDASTPADWRTLDPENTLLIELERGRVVVALSQDLAAAHVAQIKILARSGFYDGLSFYRVIDGFVAQGGLGDVREARDLGDAREALAAAFDQPLQKNHGVTLLSDHDGFAPDAGFLSGLPVGVDKEKKRIWHLHCTGAMAMARDIEKDTGGAEFYITLQPQRYLDRNLTVFGRVVRGMEHLQALRRVAPAEKAGDDPGETIKTIRVAADGVEGQREELEILRTDTATFESYVESRRNRPEEFFYHRPDHIDVCALAIPVREITMQDTAQE